MANARSKSGSNARSQGAYRGASRGGWVLIAIAVAIAALAFWFRTPAQGYARTAAAYSARVACSCRFVAGRSLDDCRKDKLAGMELVTLADDIPARSVTARFPLIARETATYREGYGCMLDRWED